jgi:hypothetical protein
VIYSEAGPVNIDSDAALPAETDGEVYERNPATALVRLATIHPESSDLLRVGGTDERILDGR